MYEYQARCVEVVDGDTQLRLVSRESVGKIIDQIRQATLRNAERV